MKTKESSSPIAVLRIGAIKSLIKLIKMLFHIFAIVFLVVFYSVDCVMLSRVVFPVLWAQWKIIARLVRLLCCHRTRRDWLHQQNDPIYLSSFRIQEPSNPRNICPKYSLSLSHIHLNMGTQRRQLKTWKNLWIHKKYCARCLVGWLLVKW